MPSAPAPPPAGQAAGDHRVPGLAAEQARAVALINEADEICLACHIRPDADALGSMLALAHALHAAGRRPQRITASFGDEPFEVP